MFTKEGASFNDIWSGEAERRREIVREMMMVIWFQYDRYRYLGSGHRLGRESLELSEGDSRQDRITLKTL